MKLNFSPHRNIETEILKNLSIAVYFFVFFSMFLCFYVVNISAQDFSVKIRASVENRDYKSAIAELETLEKSDKKSFELNNYDYLLA